MLFWVVRYELGLGVIQQEQFLNDLDLVIIFVEVCKLEDFNEKFEMLVYVGKVKDLNVVFVLNRLLKLLNRQNWYGQIVFYIVVQKGFVWFIEKLFSVGVLLDVLNVYGVCVVDVVKRYKYIDVLDIFRVWEFKQQKEVFVLGGKKLV